jgi:hypothetical protein
VNAGGLGTARAQSRLRSAVNARLEEISFRTGLITATIGLIALAAIAAAGVFAATLSLGGQAIAAAGALSSVSAPRTTPAVTASAQPITYPQASSTPQASTPPSSTTQGSAPQARQPVTADTTSPQSAAGSPPWPQADVPQAGAPQASPRYYGQAGYSHSSWYGTHGSWYGANWPRHGGFGFPAHGFGFPRQGSLGRR